MKLNKKIHKYEMAIVQKSNVNQIGQLSQNQYDELKMKLILNDYNQASIDLPGTKEKCEIKSGKWQADFCILPEEKRN